MQGLPQPGYPVQNGLPGNDHGAGGHMQAQLQQQQQQQEQPNQYKMPKINLGMSKKEEALMKQKLQGLQKDASGNGGMSYNNFRKISYFVNWQVTTTNIA